MKVIVLLLLLLGFWLLFWESGFGKQVEEAIYRTRWGMDDAARRRALEERRQLHILGEKSSFFTALERELYYSGLKLRYPKLTAEIWVAGNLLLIALVSVAGMSLGRLQVAGGGFYGRYVVLCGIIIMLAVEKALLAWLKMRNLKTVNEHLMKLLDFLGNYSITSGEVTGIMLQVSRYMEEPLKSVLEACYYEAQTTGEPGLALLGMAEKIEHPKFKELACNMEVSLRYCADFSALVSGSRRSLLEYLRSARERKGMLRESLVSMALLLGMSMVILIAVGYLVQKPVSDLLFGNMPGRIGLAMLLAIGLLFGTQLRKVHY